MMPDPIWVSVPACVICQRPYMRFIEPEWIPVVLRSGQCDRCYMDQEYERERSAEG